MPVALLKNFPRADMHIFQSASVLDTLNAMHRDMKASLETDLAGATNPVFVTSDACVDDIKANLMSAMRKTTDSSNEVHFYVTAGANDTQCVQGHMGLQTASEADAPMPHTSISDNIEVTGACTNLDLCNLMVDAAAMSDIWSKHVEPRVGDAMSKLKQSCEGKAVYMPDSKHVVTCMQISRSARAKYVAFASWTLHMVNGQKRCTNKECGVDPPVYSSEGKSMCEKCGSGRLHHAVDVVVEMQTANANPLDTRAHAEPVTRVFKKLTCEP